MLLHTLFEFLGLAVGGALFLWVKPPDAVTVKQPWHLHRFYLTVASFGATVGAYFFGTANLWLSGVDNIGRSFEGGIAGGIVAIELFKWATGFRRSTGWRFVLPLAATVAIGRIGCFLAGLPDMTYGTPTNLPWGVDFGDGIQRHPVQLYESGAMTVFIGIFVWRMYRQDPLILHAGFYFFVGFYAAQRFLWEFMKPYGTIIGPFNLFHLLSLAIIGYAIIYGRKEIACLSLNPVKAPAI